MDLQLQANGYNRDKMEHCLEFTKNTASVLKGGVTKVDNEQFIWRKTAEPSEKELPWDESLLRTK